MPSHETSPSLLFMSSFPFRAKSSASNLRAQKASEAITPDSGQDSLAASQTTQLKRVLLVDDDPGVRASLSAVLVSEGYVVITADNGQRALELAASTAIDLMLLDLNMPVKNGWDTFERFSAAHPLVPVIIVTARPNQLFTAVGAGVGALLEKPLDIPELLRTIRRLLSEPAETQLRRLAGRKVPFYYNPSDRNSSLLP
jgi:DNA-binding response OmpR family regulator